MTLIDNVSDTARWVAVYRAMETERPDAIFRDPFAARLAGEKGVGIVDAMKNGRRMAWAMIVRTKVFDEIILERVRNGNADVVLNLAAGLDARPWRLSLPTLDSTALASARAATLYKCVQEDNARCTAGVPSPWPGYRIE